MNVENYLTELKKGKVKSEIKQKLGLFVQGLNDDTYFKSDLIKILSKKSLTNANKIKIMNYLNHYLFGTNLNYFKQLHSDILFVIISYLDPESNYKLYKATFNPIYTNYNQLWHQMYCQDFVLNYQITFPYWGIIYLLSKANRCITCEKKTNNLSYFYNLIICKKCIPKDSRYRLITKTRAKNQYKLNEKDLSNLRSIKFQNPYNHNLQMFIYLESDVIKYNQTISVRSKNK